MGYAIVAMCALLMVALALGAGIYAFCRWTVSEGRFPPGRMKRLGEQVSRHDYAAMRQLAETAPPVRIMVRRICMFAAATRYTIVHQCEPHPTFLDILNRQARQP